jgi:hypothetical protein
MTPSLQSRNALLRMKRTEFELLKRRSRNNKENKKKLLVKKPNLLKSKPN